MRVGGPPQPRPRSPSFDLVAWRNHRTKVARSQRRAARNAAKAVCQDANDAVARPPAAYLQGVVGLLPLPTPESLSVPASKSHVEPPLPEPEIRPPRISKRDRQRDSRRTKEEVRFAAAVARKRSAEARRMHKAFVNDKRLQLNDARKAAATQRSSAKKAAAKRVEEMIKLEAERVAEALRLAGECEKAAKRRAAWQRLWRSKACARQAHADAETKRAAAEAERAYQFDASEARAASLNARVAAVAAEVARAAAQAEADRVAVCADRDALIAAAAAAAEAAARACEVECMRVRALKLERLLVAAKAAKRYQCAENELARERVLFASLSARLSSLAMHVWRVCEHDSMSQGRRDLYYH